MKDVAGLHFRAAVLCALTGMVMGIFMGVTEDHSARDAHAHLNLLGWVSLMLYGLYLRAHPAMATGKLAGAQFVVAVIGVVVMIASLWMMAMGNFELGRAMVPFGAMLTLCSMLMFALLVFRTKSSRA
ncbi:hypothetical protein [Roseiterribacter gracilis]|uniref:Uncharacterized protein n=1 Tax=Roseiterribacter gracilis TaxID=2812848 RepID=A0A8S8XFH4_9PROT|nr:hypothetical protein TMPK1_21220 [Rhodospirillales bacterium TMPK1]